MRTYFLWCVLAGCSFSGSDGGGDGGPDGMIGNDAPTTPAVDFLAASEVTFVETSWTITADTTIDTTTMAIVPPQPTGINISGGKQKDDTMSVAILRVKDLVIADDITVTVNGNWPLVILADGEVRIDGLLDVGAHGNKPGPGGSSTETSSGTGAASVHTGNFDDSGGGGGSFGSTGGAGGNAGPSRSPAGSAYALGSRLVGGASGGAGACSPAGAGGGSLLIYARTSIQIAGTVSAGGGGGTGGFDDCAGGASAGAGGGSGGTIWMQAPEIDGDGMLAANGGGGGGGSSPNNGGNGQDGKPDANDPAAGGTRGGVTYATAGGSGAIEGVVPSTILDLAVGNGGGGGGGLGRIVYRAPSLGELQSSPTAARAPD